MAPGLNPNHVYVGFDYYWTFLRVYLIQDDKDRHNACEQEDKTFLTHSCQYGLCWTLPHLNREEDRSTRTSILCYWNS